MIKIGLLPQFGRWCSDAFIMASEHMVPRVTACFRTDASELIGSGHVMRCLTLADELRRRGVDVMFVCREHPGHLIEMIVATGFPVVRLPWVADAHTAAPDDSVYAAWLGDSWLMDSAETITALGGLQPDWLIVDHYAVDRRWEHELRPYAGKIMVIDDLADRPHDCDLLLDQNLYENMDSRYDGLVPSHCRRLLGPHYAALRPEFREAHMNLRERDGTVRRVLVFFGGMDPANETEKALQSLTMINDRQFDVDVVVGSGNLHKNQVQNFCEAHRGFYYHCQVDNMAELMAAADLAIGAGGSTTWERCLMGLPAVVLSVAQNQYNIASEAGKAGVCLFLGSAADVSHHQLSRVITDLLNSPERITEFGTVARELVDGNGVLKIVECMLNKPFLVFS